MKIIHSKRLWISVFKGLKSIVKPFKIQLEAFKNRFKAWSKRKSSSKEKIDFFLTIFNQENLSVTQDSQTTNFWKVKVVVYIRRVLIIKRNVRYLLSLSIWNFPRIIKDARVEILVRSPLEVQKVEGESSS